MLHKHQLYNEHATLHHPSADDTDLKISAYQNGSKAEQKVPVELTITLWHVSSTRYM